jgi:hypothetical protein
VLDSTQTPEHAREPRLLHIRVRFARERNPILSGRAHRENANEVKGWFTLLQRRNRL